MRLPLITRETGLQQEEALEQGTISVENISTRFGRYNIPPYNGSMRIEGSFLGLVTKKTVPAQHWRRRQDYRVIPKYTLDLIVKPLAGFPITTLIELVT
jgi:hypothetical protein